MSFSKLGQSFSRSSSRSKSSLGGRDGGYRRWPVAGVPITVGDYGGGFDRGMRFSRGYLASIGADKGFASKAYVSDFVAVLAKSRFGRRFFSGEAPNKKKNYENFYPGEKKEIPKANENQKRQKFESKEGSSLDGEEIIFRILSVLIGGLLCKWLIELLFYLPRYGVDEDDQISFQEFKNKLLEPGLVDHIVVVVDTSLALVFVKISLQNQTSNDVTEGDNPHIRRHEGQYNSYLEIVNVRTLEKKLEEAQIALGIDPNEFVPLIYVSLHQEQAKFLPKLLCTLGINAYMIWRTLKRTGIRAGTGGIFGIGKAQVTKVDKNAKNKVYFKDVAGCNEAKQEIIEFVHFLKNPKKYKELGAKIPKGFLLVGPSGTGKTLLAKATAGESGVPFLFISGSDFVEMFGGVGPS